MSEKRKRVAVFLHSPVPAGQLEQIASGDAPRHDLLALCDRLDARLIQPESPSNLGQIGAIRRFRLLVKLGWLAWRRRNDYDVIVTDIDAVGGVLAFLLKLSRTRKGHILICHGKLAGGNTGKLTRLLRLHHQIDYFVCYGPKVASRFVNVVGVPPEKVKFVRHAADQLWWTPGQQASERMISSAGMALRDYNTLAEAVRGLDVRVVVAAFSPWGESSVQPERGVPDNVSFTRLSQLKLRSLYDRSAFVVVPVLNSNDQSGSLVIYEAMAMGKAVITAASQGQKALGLVEQGITGLYYEPGDSEGLRTAIEYLLDNPDEAKSFLALCCAVAAYDWRRVKC